MIDIWSFTGPKIHRHAQALPFNFVLTLSLLAVTCHLLIALANSLDPDQDRHFVDPDLGSILKEFFEKVNFEKKTAYMYCNRSMKNYASCKDVTNVSGKHVFSNREET